MVENLLEDVLRDVIITYTEEIGITYILEKIDN